MCIYFWCVYVNVCLQERQKLKTLIVLKGMISIIALTTLSWRTFLPRKILSPVISIICHLISYNRKTEQGKHRIDLRENMHSITVFLFISSYTSAFYSGKLLGSVLQKRAVLYLVESSFHSLIENHHTEFHKRYFGVRLIL